MTLVTNLSAYKKMIMKQTFLIKPNIRVHVHVRFTLTHKSATYIDTGYHVLRHNISCA